MNCRDTKQSAPSAGIFGACAPGALTGGLRRTRFFDGMVLTQADLENEQRFWRQKRRLTNRALGEGVAWGLRLAWDARRRVLALGPGYALDCCGNDLVVECPVEVSEAELLARADPAVSTPAGVSWIPTANDLRTPREREACVVLQYVECPEDARPVHLDPCTPPTTRCEPSRVRETARLLLVPRPMAASPSCLDVWFDDLEDIKDSITDPKLKDLLFPPPASGPVAFPDPASQLPLTLRIAVPGTGTTTETTLQPPAIGEITGGPISAVRTPTGLRAGVVQFELRPTPGWGFNQGQVTEGSTVVDRVTPPIDLQQFWSLEVTLPHNEKEIVEQFTYRVESLGLEQMFAQRAAGVADLEIRGTVRVRVAPNDAIETLVSDVRVEAKSNVGESTGGDGCLDGWPWKVMADPAHGAQDVKLLLLGAMYAVFADATARSGGAWTPQRMLAARLYTAAWRLLGVDMQSPNAEQQKQQLAGILAKLFKCWCDAMLYPGPRCTSEHHGVYLGGVKIAPSGQILAFDMWDYRRQVVLGPLVAHWLGVFGVAPIDVIAGRIAQAICCISGQPLPTLPRGGKFDPTHDLTLGNGMVWTHDTGQPATEVGRAELMRRMLGAFVAESPAPLARFRTRLADGAVVEVMAPSSSQAARHDLGAAVDAVLSRAAEKLRPLTVPAARVAVAELAREVSAAGLRALSPTAAELAKALGGMTLADLIEAGAEGILAAAPTADVASVDDLASSADQSLAALVELVAGNARKARLARPSDTLRDAGLRKALATEVPARFQTVTSAQVDAALDRAAMRVP